MICRNVGLLRNVRLLSTDSIDPNKVDEPFKVEEAETVQAPPPPSEKVIQTDLLDNSLELLVLQCFYITCQTLSKYFVT